MISRLGDEGPFADGGIGHIALHVHEVPAEVLHAVNEAEGQSSVGLAVGHGDGSTGFAAVAVKGNCVGVAFPLSIKLNGFKVVCRGEGVGCAGSVCVAGTVSLGVPAGEVPSGSCELIIAGVAAENLGLCIGVFAPEGIAVGADAFVTIIDNGVCALHSPLCGVGYILGYFVGNLRVPAVEYPADVVLEAALKCGGCILILRSVAFVCEGCAVYAVGISYGENVSGIGYIYVRPAVYGGVFSYFVAVPIPVVPFIKGVALNFADACVSFEVFDDVGSAECKSGVNGFGVCLIAVVNSLDNNLFVVGYDCDNILPCAGYGELGGFGVVFTCFVLVKVAVVEPAYKFIAVCGRIVIGNVRGEGVAIIKIGDSFGNNGFSEVGSLVDNNMNVACLLGFKACFKNSAGFGKLECAEVSEVLTIQGVFGADAFVLIYIVPADETVALFCYCFNGSVVRSRNFTVRGTNVAGVCFEGLNIGGGSHIFSGIGDMVAAFAHLNVPVNPLIGFPLCIESYIVSGHYEGAVHGVMSAGAVGLGVPAGLTVVGGIILAEVFCKLFAVHGGTEVYIDSLGVFALNVAAGSSGKLAAVGVEGELVGRKKLPLCYISNIFGCFFCKCRLPANELIACTLGRTGECRSCGTCNNFVFLFCEYGVVKTVFISYINISRLNIFEVNHVVFALSGISVPLCKCNSVACRIARTALVMVPTGVLKFEKRFVLRTQRVLGSESNIIACVGCGVADDFAAVYNNSGNGVICIDTAADVACGVFGDKTTVDFYIKAVVSAVFVSGDCAASLSGVTFISTAIDGELCMSVFRNGIDCAALAVRIVTAGNNAGAYAIGKGYIESTGSGFIRTVAGKGKYRAALAGYSFAVEVNGKIEIPFNRCRSNPRIIYGLGRILKNGNSLCRMTFGHSSSIVRRFDCSRDSGVFGTVALKACYVVALNFPLSSIGYISGYGCGNFGLPACEFIAFAGGFAIECGGCFVFFNSIGLICENLFTINAVSIGYGVGFRKLGIKTHVNLNKVTYVDIAAALDFSQRAEIVVISPCITVPVKGNGLVCRMGFVEIINPVAFAAFESGKSAESVCSRSFKLISGLEVECYGSSPAFFITSYNITDGVRKELRALAGRAASGLSSGYCISRNFHSLYYSCAKFARLCLNFSIRNDSINFTDRFLCRFFDRCGNFAAFDYVFKRVHVKGQSHGRGDVGHHHKNRKKNT